MLRSVGIERGWRVLDAGCGSGSLVPCMADLVGPSGRIVALDIAPENVEIVNQRLPTWGLPCPVEAKVGSLTALPFKDGSFDAVWCGNVLQYFSDADLLVVLAELRRVVGPGGLVAVKDVDMQLVRLHPADPFLVAHLSEVSLRDTRLGPESRGSLRGRELRRWLERAGLEEVWQRTTMIERWAPLRPVERQLWTEWLAFLAGLAEERGVPEADLPAWRTLKTPEAPGTSSTTRSCTPARARSSRWAACQQAQHERGTAGAGRGACERPQGAGDVHPPDPARPDRGYRRADRVSEARLPNDGGGRRRRLPTGRLRAPRPGSGAGSPSTSRRSRTRPR